MRGELTDYLHSQVKDISLSSARNASQADPVSPEVCEDYVSSQPRVPRVLRECITHVATCVDILCHPSHMPDLVAHVVWLYCKRLGYGLPFGPGTYRFVKHFAFLRTKEKLQRQNPLGLATAVLKAEAEGRKRHGLKKLWLNRHVASRPHTPFNELMPLTSQQTH
ncbi:unnamed protein product [Prunus armeniaca]